MWRHTWSSCAWCSVPTWLRDVTACLAICISSRAFDTGFLLHWANRVFSTSLNCNKLSLGCTFSCKVGRYVANRSLGIVFSWLLHDGNTTNVLRIWPIDIIHDTHHLCTSFRIDGIKVMSRGILGGKEKIKFANARNRGRVCLFCQNETTI